MTDGLCKHIDVHGSMFCTFRLDHRSKGVLYRDRLLRDSAPVVCYSIYLNEGW